MALFSLQNIRKAELTIDTLIDYITELANVVNRNNKTIVRNIKDIQSTTYVVPFGTKRSEFDAGAVGEMSVDDDFFYICVTAGSAGNAIWKRTALIKN
jgi:hypothetical protein